MDRRMDDAEWIPANAGRWEPEDPENASLQNDASTTTARREAVSPSSPSHQALHNAVPRNSIHRVQELFPHLINNEAQLRAYLATCEKYKNISNHDPRDSPKTLQLRPPSSSSRKEVIPSKPQAQSHPRGQASSSGSKDQHGSSRTPGPAIYSSASQWSHWSWNSKYGCHVRSRPSGEGAFIEHAEHQICVL